MDALPQEGQFVVVLMRRGSLRGCIYRRGRFQDAWSNQTCIPQPLRWFVPTVPDGFFYGPPLAGIEPRAEA